MELFHAEIMQLKDKTFGNNRYENTFFGRCLRPFLNKIYSKKVLQLAIPKKDIYTFLPLGKLSLSVRST